MPGEKEKNWTILPAESADLQAIYELQRLAYESEAALLGTRDIPPLNQSFEEVKREWETGLFLKAEGQDGAVIGSVRGQIEGDVDGTLRIGKLIVHPDFRGRGLGTDLLDTMELCYPGARYELFTSTASEGNRRLYEKQGYKAFKEEELRPGLRLAYFEKFGHEGN